MHSRETPREVPDADTMDRRRWRPWGRRSQRLMRTLQPDHLKPLPLGSSPAHVSAPGVSLNPVTTVYYVAPWTSLCIVPAILFCERGSLDALAGKFVRSPHVFIGNCLNAFLVNVMVYAIIGASRTPLCRTHLLACPHAPTLPSRCLCPMGVPMPHAGPATPA